MKYADDLNNVIKFIDNLCVLKKDKNYCLDARINETRWCTISSGLNGAHRVMAWMVYTPWWSGWCTPHGGLDGVHPMVVWMVRRSTKPTEVS